MDSTPAVPAVRARHMKTLLQCVDALPHERATSIRAAVDPATLHAIDEASGVEWLPIEPTLQVHRALHATLGHAGYEQFHRRHSREEFQGPLLRAFARGASALFGIDPGSWMRFLPAGWSALFRECGTWSVGRPVGAHVPMLLADLPVATVVDRIWATGVAASLSAAFDLARSDGNVSLVGVDQDARLARFEMRWTR